MALPYLRGATTGTAAEFAEVLRATLVRRGWATADDAENVMFFGEQSVNVDAWVSHLLVGVGSEAEWRTFCETTGIASEMIAVPAPLPPRWSGRMHDPFAAIELAPERAGGSGRWQQALGIVVGVAFIGMVMFLRVELRDRTDGSYRADGRSNLSGGAAALSYNVLPGDHEHRARGTLDQAMGHSRPSQRWEVHTPLGEKSNHSTSGNQSIELYHFHWVFDLETDKGRAQWLQQVHGIETLEGGRTVEYKRGRVAGQDAYVWDYRFAEGGWKRAIRFAQGSESVGFYCVSPREYDEAFRARCLAAEKSLKVNLPESAE